jgi:hypothetical protein
MKFATNHIKVIIVGVMALTVNIVFGAFTGNNLTDNKKYSLKNLNTSEKTFSLNALRSGSFRYKGSSDLYQKNTGNEVNVQSMIRLEKGNTSYVYPYKYTVKIHKFKTPEAPVIR